MPLPEMNDGLFRMLRFLQHHFQRALEHADIRLEGTDELEGDARDLALEVAHALCEGLEYTHGWLLEPFGALGRWRLAVRPLPTPGGLRTVAALVFEAAAGMARPLGLPARSQLCFDGAYAYLVRGERPELWVEVTAEGPQPLSRARLPIVG
ncbi:MAG: hypothetical protein ACYDCL_20800 [Myxococcales bacterium]